MTCSKLEKIEGDLITFNSQLEAFKEDMDVLKPPTELSIMNAKKRAMECTFEHEAAQIRVNQTKTNIQQVSHKVRGVRIQGKLIGLIRRY